MKKTEAGENILSIRDTLKIIDFRLIVLAQITSDFGSSLTNLALLIFVNNITHSTLALAVMAMMFAIPQVIFGLFSGTFVDQLDRKLIMIFSDVLRGSLVLGFLGAVLINQVWLLFVLAFLHASVGTFFNPARSALIPNLVGKNGIVAANSLIQTSFILFNTIGTAVAGVIIGTQNAFWLAFIVDAITFFTSASLVSFTKIKPFTATNRNSSSKIKQIREAVSIVLRTRDLLGTLVAGLVVLLGLGSLNILYVPLLINDLKVPESWFGVVQFALALAMLISGGLVTTLRRYLKPTQMISYGLVALGFSVGFIYFSSSVWQVVIIRFMVGLFAAPINASTATVVQSTVTDQIRGRVSAFYASVNSTAIVVSQGFSGVVASVIGVREMFIIIAVLSIVGGLSAGLIFANFGSFPRKTILPKGKV